jgi:autotransporter-associated beta strand protein
LLRKGALLTSTALAAVAFAAPVMAADTFWIAATANWAVDANWNNNQPNALTVNANIENGGTAQITTAVLGGTHVNISGNSIVDVRAGGSLTFGDTIFVADSTLLLSFSTNVAGTGATPTVTLHDGTLSAQITGSFAPVLSGDIGTTNTVMAANGATLTLGTVDVVGQTLKFGAGINAGLIVIGAQTSGGTEVGNGGAIEVDAGTLRAGSSQLPFLTAGATSTTVAAGAVLDMNDFTDAGGTTAIRNLQGSGTVKTGSNAATVLTLGSSDFLGVIQGAGGLRVGIFNGTAILEGNNTYTGGTTIDAGNTLQLGNGGTTGSVTGNIVDNGTLIVNHADIYGMGNISGTGNLQQVGIGATEIAGLGTYTGGTTITAGTLFIGDGNTSGSITGDVVNNGTLNFNRSDAITFSGAISGSGVVAQGGAGTTTLTGVNTYSGGTQILSGTLAVSSDANLGAASGGITFLSGGGTLQYLSGFSSNRNVALNAAGPGTFDTNGNTATLSGVISGNGVFSKDGLGNLILTGTNTYTGTTTINGGTLSVNGSIADSSLVTVNSGGTLGGTGTVGPTVVAANGALAPGNSVGTLTVNGTLAFNALSGYQVEVSPAAADRTNATGAITINNAAGIGLTALGTGFIAKSYTLLQGASLSGTFGTVGTAGSFGHLVTNPHLVYDATGLTLVLDRQSIAALLPAGISHNQSNVAAAIDRAYAAGGNPSAIGGLFGFTGAALANGLSQTSGEAATGAQSAGYQTMNSFLSLMLDPLVQDHGGGFVPAIGYAPERQLAPAVAAAYAAVTPADAARSDRRWNVWGSGYGGSASSNGDPTTGSSNTTAQAYGFAAGIDTAITPQTILGFSLGGGGTSWNLSGGLGGGRSDVFQAGLYSSTRIGPAYVSAALAAAEHWASTTRTVTVAGSDTLAADFTAQSIGGRLEGGYRFGTPGLGVTPYAAVTVQAFRTPNYSEHATSGSNAFALSYAAQTTTDTRTELGAWFDNAVALDRGNILMLGARAAWAHDFNTNRGITAVFQTLPGANFTVNGAAPSSDAALLSAKAELAMAGGWSVGAKFDGELGARSQSYAGTGLIRYTW